MRLAEEPGNPELLSDAPSIPLGGLQSLKGGGTNPAGGVSLLA